MPYPDYYYKVELNVMSTIIIATLSLLSLAGCLRAQIAQDPSGHISVDQQTYRQTL
jgi:hypothetical protein